MKYSQQLWIAAIIALCGIITLIQGHQEASAMWKVTTSDGLRLQQVYMKQNDPSLWQRDEAYGDISGIAYYTPLYFRLLDVADGNTPSYWNAESNLFAVFMVVILICSTLLFAELTQSWVLAIGLAILSLVGFRMFLHPWDYWALTSVRWMLPRVTANGAVILVFWLYWRVVTHSLMSRQRWTHWLGIGIIIGIATNLHPTTGLGLAIVMGVLCLIRMIHMRQLDPISLIMLIVSIFLISLPTTRTVTSAVMLDPSQAQSSAKLFSVNFQTISDRIDFFSVLQSNTNGLLLLVAWTTITAITWLGSLLTKRVAIRLAFCSVQLMTLGFFFADIHFVFVGLIMLFIIIHRNDPIFDNIYHVCEIIAAILFCFFVGFTSLTLLSIVTQNERYYSYASQLSRVLRSVNVPIFMLIALVVRYLLNEYTKPSLTHLFAMLFVIASFSERSLLICPALVISYLIYWRFNTASWWRGTIERLAYAIFAALITFTLLYMVVKIYIVWLLAFTVLAGLIAIVTFGRWKPSKLYWITSGLCLVGLIGLALLGINLTSVADTIPQQLFSALAGVVLVVLVYFMIRSIEHQMPLKEVISAQGLPTLAAMFAAQAILALLYNTLFFQPLPAPPYVAIAQWTRSNTDKNALIFVAINTLSFSERPPLFRIHSERSSTDVTQDFLAAASDPVAYQEQRENQTAIQASFATSDTLIAKAQELSTDYIVIDSTVLGYKLPLPPLHQEGDFVIYETP